jgi:hypothetical protein
MIVSSVRSGSVFLLRFHGHGAPGVAGISFGQGGVGFGERADIDNADFAEIRPALARLRPIFGPYGNVQFMHCETGSVRRARRYFGPWRIPGRAGYCGGAYSIRRRNIHLPIRGSYQQRVSERDLAAAVVPGAA